MTSHRAFEIPDHVVARRVGDETVILDLESGTYFGLDPVGARIWELIAEGHTLDSICATMLEEYEVDEERLQEDVRALVQDLGGRGLLR